MWGYIIVVTVSVRNDNMIAFELQTTHWVFMLDKLTAWFYSQRYPRY